jgi:type IV pilus assembly protein PilO
MNLDAIEGIPRQQRYIAAALIYAAVIGLFFGYPFRSHYKQIQMLNKNIVDLERNIVVNKSLAEKKDELLSRNAELQQRLLEVQQKFPTSSEVTDLLKQVSVLGQQSGLDVQLWKPRGKVKSPSNLYYEIPVEIEVLGGYHDVGIFFDRISKLPRIVNIADLAMSNAKTGGAVLTKCVAKTFSALSLEEMGAPKKK